MSENDLELKVLEPKTIARDPSDLNEPLLEHKNVEIPVVQPPIESCEAKLQRTIENSCLSYTYLRTIPLINIPIDMIRDTFADHTPPPDPTSIAVQHSKLYAGLGIFSKLSRLGAATLPVLSSSTKLLQIVQENKSTFNEGYIEGIQKGYQKPYSSGGDFFVVASEASQGIIQLTAFPIAFLGAQKIASAKNMKAVLKGIVFLGAGVTAIILNSTHNYTSQLVRDQGEYYGYLCSGHAGCVGEQEQLLPTVPTGINGFVSSISAVACGFIYGLTERARDYMCRTSLPDPASDNKSINS